MPTSDNKKQTSIDPRVPSDVAELVRRDAIDLTNLSTFCCRQADCAALFAEGIDRKEPEHFVLKSPFRENFIESLFCYIYTNSRFSAAETIAIALRRHAEWYLSVRDIDRIRSRFDAETHKPLRPALLRGPLEYWEGFIGEDGEFARNAEMRGTPCILVFQEIVGDDTSLALEIRGRDVARKDRAFRKTLLKSALKEVLLHLDLEQPRRGRPHEAQTAEKIAFFRDHENFTALKLAQEFCNCMQGKHNRRCFDRLNKLADSFYSVQRSRFENLVKRQGRKNS